MAVATKRSHDAAFPQVKAASSKLAKPALAPMFGPSKLKWVTRNQSLWHLRYDQPVPSSRVACFDLDGCLIYKSKESPWWHPSVPGALRSLVEGGTAVFIITNQGFSIEGDGLKRWKEQIENVLNRLKAPCHVLAAVGGEGHDTNLRKPMPGLFEHVKQLNGVDIDLSQSFYVGDAAGRPKDHSDSDRKWALNVGMPFYTPEQFFLKQAEEKYMLWGFDGKKALAQNLPLFAPTNSPLLPLDSSKADLVLLVGLPCSGQTSFCRKYLESANYERVDKSGPLGAELVDQILAKGGKAVVDTELVTVRDRQHFVDAASKRGVDVRCFRIATSPMQSWHNNLFRAFAPSAPETRRPIAISAFQRCRTDFAEPTLDEGFVDIKRINWTLWDASEAAKREYAMHYQINRAATKEIEGIPKLKRY